MYLVVGLARVFKRLYKGPRLELDVHSKGRPPVYCSISSLRTLLVVKVFQEPGHSPT